MKKIITSVVLALSVFALANIAQAKVDRVSGDFSFSDPFLVTYVIGGSEYHHSYDITMMDPVTGDFSGTGTYLDAPGYIESITGNIIGSQITFTILYLPGSINPGYTLSVEGTINPDGSMTGFVEDTSITWSAPIGSVVQFVGNHGQYVRSQEDKQSAAQSRIGMPVQSMGHVE
jgi:hypothetical protein